MDARIRPAMKYEIQPGNAKMDWAFARKLSQHCRPQYRSRRRAALAGALQGRFGPCERHNCRDSVAAEQRSCETVLDQTQAIGKQVRTHGFVAGGGYHEVVLESGQKDDVDLYMYWDQLIEGGAYLEIGKVVGTS